MAVLHIKAPTLPAYRFEWHAEARKVYLVRLGTLPEQGEIVAFDIATHGDAINAVLIWTRGFREGQTPHLTKPHLTE